MAYPSYYTNKMNLWTRYNLECPSDQSFNQLNMKRKAETLKYKKNAFAISKKELFNLIVQGRYYNNKTPATDPSSCTISLNHKDSSPASTNDVPGNKSFIITDDIHVPIYNYIPVKRTYKGGANKYPYTTWSYGRAGFPVGSKGTSAKSRAIAAYELSANAPLYNKLALFSCDFIPCRSKELIVTCDCDSIYQYSHIMMDEYSLKLPKKLQWLGIPDYSPLYDVGGAWGEYSNNYKIIHLVTVHNNKWGYYFIYNNKSKDKLQLQHITTKPFMSLLETNTSMHNTITFNQNVLVDKTCKIFFNYSQNDSNIPFDLSTSVVPINQPNWIKQTSSTAMCNNKCYWFSSDNTKPSDVYNIHFGNLPAPPPPYPSMKKIITTKKNYEITIHCT